MPSMVAIKDLYYAKSIDELKRKAEANLDSKLLEKRKIENLIQVSNKFYNGANESLRGGDHEIAFVFYYRFLSLLDYISDDDKPKFLSSLGKKIAECVKQLEHLQESLVKRYVERQKLQDDRKALLFNNQPTPGTSVKIDTTTSDWMNAQSSNVDGGDDEEDDDEYPTVTSKELIESIHSQSSQINKVLIIDIRSAEDFDESSIAANKMLARGEVNIINIPSQQFGPSMTYSMLSKSVTFGIALDALERRRTMDRVVIMDHGTHHFEKDSHSVILAMALFKWDLSPERIKKKPYLLKGGYSDFVITYPTYVTNSNIINKSFNLSSTMVKPIRSLNLYDFDEENKPIENEEPSFPVFNKMTNNNVTPISSSALNGYIANNLTNNNSSKIMKTNNFTSFATTGTMITNQKVPGIAKPFIPPRSTKPRIESSASLPTPPSSESNSTDSNLKINIKDNNTTSVIDPNKLLMNLPPKPGHLISSMSGIPNGHAKTITDNNGDRKMDISDDDDLVAGNFDEDLNNQSQQTKQSTDSILQTPVHRRGQARFNINDDDDMSEEEEDEEMISADEHSSTMTARSKPITMNRPITNNGTFGPKPFSPPSGSSLARSLSSPNIAQFAQDSEQQFSFNSVGSMGTPKFSQAHPMIDRSVKPVPYQALLRKQRDFSEQFSSCPRITGLKNLGNTCFMNSILQCLNNTSELSDHLRNGSVHINPNSKFGSNGELTIELMELFKKMVYPSNFKHISPKDLKCAVTRHIPDFVEYKQQDAHEFLVRFLDRIHADLNKCANVQVVDPVTKDPNYYDNLSMTSAANRFWTLHLERNKSIIADLFEGLLVSTLTCVHCKFMSKALEAFTCLTLPIQEGCGRTTIKTSLEMFLRRERISDEAAWQCPTCKQKRDAEKCTYIYKLPKVLVIHLKRFSYDGLWRQKISTFVDFPIDNLTIEARDESNRSYSLYGVVNHTGSLEGGHYISFGRNLEMGINWQRYDDQDVSPVSASDVITQNAYVLFYKQMNS